MTTNLLTPTQATTAITITSASLAGLAPGEYTLQQGVYTVTGSVTVPTGVTLRFERGAVLKPAAGARITFNEIPEAGQYQIFDYSLGGRVGLADAARTGEVRIEWWGADATGRWDNALLWAMDTIGATELGHTSVVGRGGVIRFGRGIYEFGGDAPFSRFNYVGIKRGFEFRGEGPQSTLLYLVCGSAPRWFYDSTDKNGRWSFYDLGFSSNNEALGCGFRHTSNAGEEKEFRYYNCFFGQTASSAFAEILAPALHGMNIGFSYNGANNADLNKWFGCRFGGFSGGLLHFNNNQSVSHAMYGCDAELHGTFAITHEKAGGDLKVYGGTLVLITPPTDPPTLLPATVEPTFWVVDHGPSAELWAGNSTFVFNGVRFEFHDKSSIVRKQQETFQQGVTNTVFRDCDMYVPPTSPVRSGVSIVQNALVAFERTNIPSTVLTYNVVPLRDYVTVQGTGGIILFDTCDIPPNLRTVSSVGPPPVDGVAQPKSGGRVIAQGCYSHARGAAALPRTAIDFDLGWENMARYDRAVARKMVAIKAQVESWPTAPNGAEQTVLLPEGAVITGIRVVKPASGSDPASYRLNVGTNGKGTIYGSSAPSLAIKDEHRIILSDLSIDCGTATDTRTVRLWMTGTATSLQTDIGYAIVEYI